MSRPAFTSSVLRPAWVMQNFTDEHLPVIQDMITVPTGNGAEAFVDAADIAAVAVETLADGLSRPGQLPPDELDDVSYLGSRQRDVSARVRVQGLLRRAQQVIERETVLPGEQLVVPLEQEQNWRPDGPRGRCERLRSFGQTLLTRPAEIRRPAEEPEHGRLHPGFGR
jgi:hypothetical protein